LIHRATHWSSSRSRTSIPCSPNKSLMAGLRNTGKPDWHIVPQGDRSLLLVFGEQIDIETGRRCALAATTLRAAHIPGISDIVPSFNQLAVHYRPGSHDAANRLAHLTAAIQT